MLRIIIDEWERENGDGKDDKDDNNRNKDNKGILTHVEEWWSMNETKNDDWGKDWWVMEKMTKTTTIEIG